jgi:hypothetical protein
MATFNTAFGSLSKDMKMQAGLPQLPGTQQLQAQAGAQQPQRPAPQQTFAAMQQQGMARPAPQPAPPPAQSQAFLGQLQQQVSQLQQAPSVYAAPQIQQMRQAQQAELEAQFGAQRQMLQEELARRGIADSTIAAGRFGDVAGQQARALASMEADLLTRAAEAQQQREQAITSALIAGAGEARAGEFGAAGLTGMLGGAQTLAAQQQAEQARQFNLQQQLAETLGLGGLTGQVGATPTLEAQRLRQQAALEGRSLDIQEATAQANVNIRAQELQQQAAQFGQSLTLDQARLQAQQEQFAAEQQLAREREIGVIGGKESIAARALTAEQQRFEQQLEEQKAARLQQLGISQDQLKLQAEELKQRELLQGREISSQQAMQQVEVDARAKNLATQIEADAKAQGRSITAEQALQEGRIKAEKEMQKERVDQAESEFQRTLTADEQRFDEQLKEQKRAALAAEGFTEREITLRKDAFELEKVRFKFEADRRKEEFDKQLELDTNRLGLSKTEVENRQKQFDAQLAQEKEQFDQNLDQRKYEFATEVQAAEDRFTKTLDEDARQFNDSLENRRDEVYAQYAGLVKDKDGVWKQTIQAEAVKGEQQLATQELLIKLADLMGGRLTDADFADLMSKLGLGKNGGGRDETGTGEDGTQTKEKTQRPPIDIFDPGYTPEGEIE